MRRDAQIYLFESSDAPRYALSVDMTGCNVPADYGGWLLRGEWRVLCASCFDVGSAITLNKKRFR